MSDEALMTAYGRHGDTKAFELLLARYRHQIMGYLMNSVRHRSTAEELYQETFLRVIRSARSYTPRASFRTWIFTIARRLIIDLHRKRATHPGMISLDTGNPDERAYEEPAADSERHNPDRLLHAHEIRLALQEVLDSLPPEQREMFLLREEAGLDFKSAARVARCSVNTAKSRMRYALVKLRDELRRRGFHQDTQGLQDEM